MILPIVAYGHPMLKKKSAPVSKDCPELTGLLADRWETLEKTGGVGLAAPQVNRSIRLFIVDANQFSSTHPEAKDFKKVFINPNILGRFGDQTTYKEGCLSLPGIGEDIVREDGVLIEYLDESFEKRTGRYTGIISRIIQHEYDHLEGHTFIDRIGPLRKTLLQSKLKCIRDGKCKTEYPMIFLKSKKKTYI